jgi:phenylacetate-CoA ligase
MNKIVEFTGFRINDFFKGYSVDKNYREFLKQASQLSKSDIDSIKLAKFQKLISFAYSNTSFYNERLKSIGAFPEDFTNLDDIAKIPELKREDLQNHWRDIIPKKLDVNSLNKGSSSGSTGVPVVYFKNNESSSLGQAAGYACWSFAGWSLGMKGLHIWGNPTTVNNEWNRLSSKLKAWYLNHHKFPAYQLTQSGMLEKLYNQVLNGKYEFIDGYTNSIYLFAEYVKANYGSLKPHLKMVLTTAENLHDYQRKLIEESLGPVYDLYGCSEINGIAGECKICGKYHIIDTHVLLEFGKEVDEFKNQELIITDLDNYAFPLIRYKNNDLGKPYMGSSSCSIPFSRMEHVSGRQSDIIKLPDGGSLSVPSFFGSMLLKKVNGIRKYQIEKDKFDHLNINFVVNSEFSTKDMELIRLSLNDYIGSRIKWDINIVDTIQAAPNGKYKLVIDNTIKK